MSLQTPAASRDTTPEPSHKKPEFDPRTLSPEDLNLIKLMLQRVDAETGNEPEGQSKTERLRQANAQAVRKQQEDERSKASETISQDNTKELPDEPGKESVKPTIESDSGSVKPTIESDSGSVKPTDQSGKASMKPTIESDSGSVEPTIEPSSEAGEEDQLTEAESKFISKHGGACFPGLLRLSGERSLYLVNTLGPRFKKNHQDRDLVELFGYADFAIETMDDEETAFSAIEKFADNAPAWEKIAWGTELDTTIRRDRLLKARDLINDYRTGVQPIPLSEQEIKFLNEYFKDSFPGLAKLPSSQAEYIVETSAPEFKGRHQDRDVLQFLSYADFAHRTMSNPDPAIKEFIKNPPERHAIPWDDQAGQAARIGRGLINAGDLHARLQQDSERSNLPATDTAQGLQETLSETTQVSKSSNLPTTDTGEEYDSEARRKMRAKFHGQGDAKANVLTFTDPETGTAVTGEILGRHPQRPKWLAVALPGLKEKAFSRGYYVDCSNSEQRLALEAYITRGANKILSFATHKDQLDGCIPEEFELNLVLVMPWGKSFRYNAYGIPHYKLDRDFMVFSKSILTSASKWGNETMGVLHGHMLKAGQTIPKARSETPKPQGVKRGAWKH